VSDFGDPNKEKMRLCPTCRMEISTLATKCRFCGETVGRPRDESRSLSIDDLGGETIRHYAPSSSVMEAMESFRAETEISSNPPADALPEKKGFLGLGGRKAPEAKAPSVSDGLPQLDARSQVLAELAIPKTAPKAVRRPPPSTNWIKKAGVFAGLIAAMVILYFGGVQVLAMMNRKLPPTPVQFINPAKAMLAENANPAETLEEAVKALAREDHPDNRVVLNDARRKFVAAINDLLYKKPWKDQYLSDASRMVNRAFKCDSGEDIRSLKEEVDREIFAYGMVLLETSDSGEAVFNINNQSKTISGPAPSDVVRVKAGDVIQERFKVDSIGKDFVQVEDTLRENRSLTYHRGSMGVSSP
jgi:hypothetical protein